MKGKYLRRIGGFILAVLMLSGLRSSLEHGSGAGASQSGDCSHSSESHLSSVWLWLPERWNDPFGYDRWVMTL